MGRCRIWKDTPLEALSIPFHDLSRFTVLDDAHLFASPSEYSNLDPVTARVISYRRFRRMGPQRSRQQTRGQAGGKLNRKAGGVKARLM